jgi:hypothetical protein
MTNPSTKTFTHIAIGNHHFGLGNTVGEAIANRAERTNDEQYEVGRWSVPVSEVKVNMYGQISWRHVDPGNHAQLEWLTI